MAAPQHPLMEKMGISAEEIGRRKAWLDLTTEDEARLAGLRDMAGECANDVVEALYRHILAFPEASRHFSDPELLRRVQEAQRNYLVHLTLGDYAEDYVEDRLRIGEAHARVGVDVKWYVGAFAVYTNLVMSRLLPHVEGDAARAMACFQSLLKVIFLDLGLALDTYVFESQAQLRTFNQVLEDQTQRLAVANEALETVSRHKSDFLANMSHEIRTPMNAVLGMTGLLLESNLTPEQRNYAEIVRSSGSSLMTLLNDLLDLARIESGKIALEPLPLDLPSVLESVAEQVAVRAHQKSLEVAVYVAPGVPRHLVGDEGRLRQVLLNLASNAIKFTPRGSVLLQADIQEEREREVVLRLSVTDTGIGIPEDRLDDVFEKFTQVDPSRARRFEGAGLGLAISKELVECMGGRIGARSQPDVGSTFWFTVPLPLVEDPPPPLVASSDLAGIRVLAVDDDPVHCHVLRDRLRDWRIRADICTSGEEALDLLRTAAAARDPYHIALLDHSVAAPTGQPLHEAICANAVLHDTLLVTLLPMARWSEVGDWREAGFAACVLKPIRASHLFDTLVAVAELTRNRSSMPPDAPTAGRAAVPIRPARVLIVEDHTVNRQVIAAMLASRGLTADAAGDGSEAIQMLEMLPYDLILMDCAMPGMNGFEATAEIRRREAGSRRIPIVALTAHAMSGDRERCLEAGMDDYLSKPLQMEALESVLQRWIPQALQ